MNALWPTSFRGRRAGATLMEVVVALALLGMVGLIGVELTRSAGHAVESSLASETAMRTADDFLNAVSVWSRTELEQRLGSREQGPWRQEIERISASLYIVTLRDSADAETILRTALFRQEDTNAAR